MNGDEADIDCGGSCPNGCAGPPCDTPVDMCNLTLNFDGLNVAFESGEASGPDGVLNIQLYHVGEGGWTGPYQLCNDWTEDNTCIPGRSITLPLEGEYAMLAGGVDGCSTFYYEASPCNDGGGANENEESDNETESIQIDQLYPNPVSDQLVVMLSSKKLVDAQIRIMNAQGGVVLTSSETLQHGINQFEFDTEDFPPGIYYLFVEGFDGKKKAVKFIKVRTK